MDFCTELLNHLIKKEKAVTCSCEIGKQKKDNVMPKNDKFYPREECGVVGVFNVPEAAKFAYLGIYALQHRGQESAGIVSSHEGHVYRYANMGKVTDVFTDTHLEKLLGKHAIAHNRYSTTGASYLRNAQPIRVESHFGVISIAHNGNIANAWALRDQLQKQGAIFQTTADTEVICHLMATSGEKDFSAALIAALSQMKGAYSLVVLANDTLYAVRDPNGFRPLVMGKKDDGYIFASETCALDIMDAEYEREVLPGEFIKVSKNSVDSFFPFGKTSQSLCIFEYIYFSRPDSIIFDRSVYDVRFTLGEKLAMEHGIDADVVIPVPDSSVVSAIGYSKQSGIPFHTGLIRSHYVGRTFIEPDQKIRDFGAKLKYNAIKSVVKGKRVIVVDDSIMRGTTQRKIITMLRKIGAKEIHVRIASSPTRYACYYGIDIPSHSELIASSHKLDEIKKYLRVDSIAYVSMQSMIDSAGSEKKYCTACFDGNYPLPLDFDSQNLMNQKELFTDYEAGEVDVT